MMQHLHFPSQSVFCLFACFCFCFSFVYGTLKTHTLRLNPQSSEKERQNLKENYKVESGMKRYAGLRNSQHWQWKFEDLSLFVFLLK